MTEIMCLENMLILFIIIFVIVFYINDIEQFGGTNSLFKKLTSDTQKTTKKMQDIAKTAKQNVDEINKKNNKPNIKVVTRPTKITQKRPVNNQVKIITLEKLSKDVKNLSSISTELSKSISKLLQVYKK